MKRRINNNTFQNFLFAVLSNCLLLIFIIICVIFMDLHGILAHDIDVSACSFCFEFVLDVLVFVLLCSHSAPTKDLITVYCAFIRPVLEYASPV